jgi:S1-C subfamily serine protease
VTIADVINESVTVKVTLGTDEYLATVVGVDQDKDIAVLKVVIANTHVQSHSTCCGYTPG